MSGSRAGYVAPRRILETFHQPSLFKSEIGEEMEVELKKVAMAIDAKKMRNFCSWPLIVFKVGGR